MADIAEISPNALEMLDHRIGTDELLADEIAIGHCRNRGDRPVAGNAHAGESPNKIPIDDPTRRQGDAAGRALIGNEIEPALGISPTDQSFAEPCKRHRLLLEHR